MLFDPELHLEKIQSMAKNYNSLHFFLFNKEIIVLERTSKKSKNSFDTLLILTAG